jgi:hypothetical protein
MEYRRLGRSGLFVSAFTLGTITLGGQGGFSKVGSTDVAGAKRQVVMCLDAGINLFDTANFYSGGESEEILGEAISGRRDDLLHARGRRPERYWSLATPHKTSRPSSWSSQKKSVEVSALPLIYPFWHQAKTASDRLGPADLPLLGSHVNNPS